MLFLDELLGTGAVDAVVRIIRAHLNDSKMCEAGCNILNNIMLFDANSKRWTCFFSFSFRSKMMFFLGRGYKAQPGKDPIIDVLSKVVTTHIDNAKVCKVGCDALFGAIIFNGKHSLLFTR